MKLLIVGGVAGGASAAARARRLSESAEIVMVERGAEPSFANCGMPYYIGGQIQQRQKLLVSSSEQLHRRFRIDVRTRSEAVSIDRAARTVRIRELDTGREYDESYDKLILSPGAAPQRPPFPGADLPSVYTLRVLADADRLHALALEADRSVVILGAGFIGLEMVENLLRRGQQVTLVELARQVLPPADPEMAAAVATHLRENGVRLVLGASAERLTNEAGRTRVHLSNQETIDCDYVIMAVGVRPESQLAVDAGIACGPRGGIQTNRHMQTSDPHVYAVGDAVEVNHYVSETPTQIPLGGPANRQGRIAAEHALGRSASYRGTQGTAVLGVFELTAAMTGLSERQLRQSRTPYEKIYIHPMNHAGYYPGAKQMVLELLFAPEDGRILGAQAVGREGVEKRIDVLSMAIQARMTVFDLEEAELCYAPQYGSAKDPVNMAGFVAAAVLRGDHPVVHADQVAARVAEGALLLDVRSPAEFAEGHLPDARNLPVDELRDHLQDLPRDRPLVVYCRVGQRGYVATRILAQEGFQVSNVSGGYLTWSLFQAADQG
jgi:NADPH-dependent 2,4-dienoyl-CoA reductase/sulfur reductase-like enzyme/rhodanese-related sulfurtransferase